MRSARWGLGFANIGGLLMTAGIPYDSARGPRAVRRAVGDHDRRRLCDLGGDGSSSSAPFAGFEEQSRADAEGHAQSCARGTRRDIGL